MLPTLQVGDKLQVDTTARPPRHGEIWLYRGPISGTAREGQFIKRVIGIPGDTIETRGGRIHVNGKALTEPYLKEPVAYRLKPLKLGPKQYFVLGDNRNNSLDSHVLGPLHRAQFIGRAVLRRRY